jgi:hypothetical protein
MKSLNNSEEWYKTNIAELEVQLKKEEEKYRLSIYELSSKISTYKYKLSQLKQKLFYVELTVDHQFIDTLKVYAENEYDAKREAYNMVKDDYNKIIELYVRKEI